MIVSFFVLSQTPLGIIFKDENVNEDMLEILKQFHSYLPAHTSTAHNNTVFAPKLFAGDQLTVERAVNVIQSTANGYTAQDKLEGLNMQLGDWHTGLKILSVSKLYYQYTLG